PFSRPFVLPVPCPLRPALLPLLLHHRRPHRPPHSFPTRRSSDLQTRHSVVRPSAGDGEAIRKGGNNVRKLSVDPVIAVWANYARSEEHTSELQSRFDLVCRLLLEKKKKRPN